MRNAIKILGIIVFTMFTAFVLITCGNDGGGDETIPSGKITITGLPNNLYLKSCLAGTFSGGDDFIGSMGGHPHDFVPESSINHLELREAKGNLKTSITQTGNGWDFTGSCEVRIAIYYLENNELFFNYNIPGVTFVSGQSTITWASFSFSLPETDGEFTLTNASSYNDKYVILFGTYGNVSSPTALYGFDDATSITALKGFKIENGSVTLPVYKIDFGATQFTPYSGSDTVTSLVLIILDNDEFDYLHYAANGTNYKYLLYSTASSNSVTFNSGEGSADAANATKYPVTGW